jgi:cardiolipin synthase A/B
VVRPSGVPAGYVCGPVGAAPGLLGFRSQTGRPHSSDHPTPRSALEDRGCCGNLCHDAAVYGLFAIAWPYALLVGWVVVAAWASGHAILAKRDSRAAIGWTGLIWLAPFFGALFYLLLGINRVERRARRLRGETTRYRGGGPEPHSARQLLAETLPPNALHMAALVERVARRPLLDGNRVLPLQNGDQAYPEMLGAIDSAQHSVWLLSYIFDASAVGKDFIAALIRAHARGVQVRVLLDDAGSNDTQVDRALRAGGVPVDRFLPARLSRRLAHFNLRNHRKLLVVDGCTGFTGGINIHGGHLLGKQPKWPVRDTHFRLDGPIVEQLREVFAEDWEFTTGEAVHTALDWSVRARPGGVAARGIADGPDERMGGVRLTLLGALACATHSVKIVTPYFLPDQGVITALRVAGLRGVEIDIVLPARSDVRIVDFATRAQLWQVFGTGIRVWMSSLPFDHSKLMVMDNYWSFIGSANWDARSFRLNFEFNVECYDRELASHLNHIADERIGESREITSRQLDARSLAARLRDGICRLASPYL